MGDENLFSGLDNPISHTHDPVTSKVAAARVTRSGVRGKQAARVLALVRANPGCTAIELLDAQDGPAPLLEYQIRRRLTDLHKAGHLIQGGERPCRVRGTLMVVWFPRPSPPTETERSS